MDINELTIGEAKQLSCLFGEKTGSGFNLSGKKILVLQRGWVVVGDVSQCGSQVTCKNASVIRRWGTKSGIGEIAKAGPTNETKLDEIGTIQMHELAIVLAVDCEVSEWK